MEQTHDRVLQGKVIHDQSYQYKRKEFQLDDLIQLDLIDGKYVGEVKSSRKMAQADRMQLIYYLFYLKQLGIERKGKLHYVIERKVEEVELTPQDEQEIADCLKEIQHILSLSSPPKIEKYPYCKSCAYYPFCFIGELEE